MCVTNTVQMHAPVATCAYIKYSILWKDRAQMEALSPEQQSAPSPKCSYSWKSCQAREPCTVVERSLGARVVSSHSYVFHLCRWTEGASPGKGQGRRGSQLLRDNFWGFGNWTVYWGLDNSWDITNVVLEWENFPGASLTALWYHWAQRFESLTSAAEQNWRKSGAVSKMWTFLKILP